MKLIFIAFSFLVIFIAQYHAQNQPTGECPSGSISDPTDPNSCLECDGGTIAVNGSCNPCPIGTFSYPGSTECLKCKPGSVSQSLGASACKMCFAGTYSVDGLYCMQCPGGTLSPHEAASLDECIPCDEGSVALPGSSSCTRCKVGEYAFKGVYCAKCPQGTYSFEGYSNCTACPPGSASSPLNGEGCYRCGRSTYSFFGLFCNFCPAGTQTEKEGANSIDECVPCPPGTAPSSFAICDRCSEGTYSPDGAYCLPCPYGTSSGTGAKSLEECIQCPSGTIITSRPEKSLHFFFYPIPCIECFSGEYALHGVFCDICPVGTYSEFRSASCSVCADGTVAGSEGSKECTKCAEGLSSVGGIYCA